MYRPSRVVLLPYENDAIHTPRNVPFSRVLAAGNQAKRCWISNPIVSYGHPGSGNGMLYAGDLPEVEPLSRGLSLWRRQHSTIQFDCGTALWESILLE